MKAAGETLMELAADSKFLGANTGVTTILHTWGQNLSFHPHVHCIVPGGGLAHDGLSFVSSNGSFFLTVKVLSRKFRGKFLAYVKKAWRQGKLLFFGDALEFKDDLRFMNFLGSLYSIEWVVNCKKPFASPEHVLKYLGRYTHRVAISNARIVSFDGDDVVFLYKDYKDGGKRKRMKLSAVEFVRRFLLHVLPTGFTKIRHYGILASRNLATKLVRCLRLLNKIPVVRCIEKFRSVCPKCGAKMEPDSSILVAREHS